MAVLTNSHVSLENARRLLSNLITVSNAVGTPHVGARAQVAVCGRGGGSEGGREKERGGEERGISCGGVSNRRRTLGCGLE